MTHRFTPRAISLALSAIVTFSMLAGIDALALNEPAASDLLARAASTFTPT